MGHFDSTIPAIGPPVGSGRVCIGSSLICLLTPKLISLESPLLKSLCVRTPISGSAPKKSNQQSFAKNFMEEFHSHRVLPLSPPESTIFLGFQLADGKTNYQEHIPELSVWSRPVKSQSCEGRGHSEGENKSSFSSRHCVQTSWIPHLI